jgi:ribosomal protein S27E
MIETTIQNISTFKPTAPAHTEILYWDDEPFNLAEDLAKRVTGSGNLDATILLIGERGSGKSEAALGLAEGTMNAISKLSPNRSLKDIFDWQRDIAVIDLKNTLKVLNAPRPKSSIVLLDDMSVSIDSRKHQTKENIDNSHVWITMRSLRQVVIGTTISGSLIDKRARDNFAYVILMKPKKPYDHIFGQNKGVRMGDLRGVYRNELNDQIRFPRIKGKEHGNNVVYNNIYCFPPGEDLLKYYNEFRESEAERLRQIAGNEQPHQETKKQKNSYILTCPKCFKTDIRYSRKEKISYCRTCGTIIKTDGGENGAPSAY